VNSSRQQRTGAHARCLEAAVGVADRQQGSLGDACTLRDLDRICLTTEIEPSLVEVPVRERVGWLDEESTCRVDDCLVRGDIVSPSSRRDECGRGFWPLALRQQWSPWVTRV
jgi:hypothetical protein